MPTIVKAEMKFDRVAEFLPSALTEFRRGQRPRVQTRGSVTSNQMQVAPHDCPLATRDDDVCLVVGGAMYEQHGEAASMPATDASWFPRDSGTELLSRLNPPRW